MIDKGYLAPAAIDCCPCQHSAANQPYAAAAVDRRDRQLRQMDRRTDTRPFLWKKAPRETKSLVDYRLIYSQN